MMKKVIAVVCSILVSTIVVGAQGQTKTRYEAMPVHNGGIIFTGDSITDDCEWNELFSNQNILNRGIDGNNSSTLLQRVYELTRHKPEKIFFAIGTNDLPGNPIEKVLQNMNQIFDAFASESPNTKIYIQSVLPVGPAPMFMPSDSDKKNALIRELNDAYKKLCAEKGFTYIDVYSSFIDSEGRYIKKELTSDDLHISGQGYLVWKSIVEPYVR